MIDGGFASFEFRASCFFTLMHSSIVNVDFGFRTFTNVFANPSSYNEMNDDNNNTSWTEEDFNIQSVNMKSTYFLWTHCAPQSSY